MPEAPCKLCGNNITNKEKTCPHCGADVSRTSPYIWAVAAIIVGIIVAPFIVLSFDPEKTPEEKAVLLEQIEAENRRVRLLQEQQMGSTINGVRVDQE